MTKMMSTELKKENKKLKKKIAKLEKKIEGLELAVLHFMKRYK